MLYHTEIGKRNRTQTAQRIRKIVADSGYIGDTVLARCLEEAARRDGGAALSYETVAPPISRAQFERDRLLLRGRCAEVDLEQSICTVPRAVYEVHMTEDGENLYATSTGTLSLVRQSRVGRPTKWNRRHQTNFAMIEHGTDARRFTSATMHLKIRDDLKEGDTIEEGELLGTQYGHSSRSGIHTHVVYMKRKEGILMPFPVKMKRFV